MELSGQSAGTALRHLQSGTPPAAFRDSQPAGGEGGGVTMGPAKVMAHWLAPRLAQGPGLRAQGPVRARVSVALGRTRNFGAVVGACLHATSRFPYNAKGKVGTGAGSPVPCRHAPSPLNNGQSRVASRLAPTRSGRPAARLCPTQKSAFAGPWALSPVPLTTDRHDSPFPALIQRRARNFPETTS